MELEELIVQYIDMLSASMRQSVRDYRELHATDELLKLSITQLHYLHAIKEIDNVTFRDLVAKFHVQKSTVTDSVNRLIKAGLVCKKQSAEDLRVFHLYLTEKGRELLSLENQGYYKFAQKMTACLTEQEKKQFAQVLQKISDELQE